MGSQMQADIMLPASLKLGRGSPAGERVDDKASNSFVDPDVEGSKYEKTSELRALRDEKRGMLKEYQEIKQRLGSRPALVAE